MSTFLGEQMHNQIASWDTKFETGSKALQPFSLLWLFLMKMNGLGEISSIKAWYVSASESLLVNNSDVLNVYHSLDIGIEQHWVVSAIRPHTQQVEKVVGIDFQPGLGLAKIISASQAGNIQFLDMRSAEDTYLTVDVHGGSLTAFAIHWHAPDCLCVSQATYQIIQFGR